MPEQTSDLDTVYLTVVQIYQFHDEANGQTLWWNATEGRRLAEGRTAEVVLVYPAEFGMDKARILHMNADLDQQKALALPATALLSPLLFVEHNGKHILIDGWHRLFLAVSCGVPCLPAYILTQAEADMIRVAEAKSIRIRKRTPNRSILQNSNPLSATLPTAFFCAYPMLSAHGDSVLLRCTAVWQASRLCLLCGRQVASLARLTSPRLGFTTEGSYHAPHFAFRIIARFVIVLYSVSGLHDLHRRGVAASLRQTQPYRHKRSSSE